MNQPGQILNARVDGRSAKVYLTLSHLDVDGKPRWRYAPGHRKQHEVIDKSCKVEIVGIFDRLAKKK